MAIRLIRQAGDEILRKKSREVDVVDEKIVEILNDMVETMHKYDGVGLAGPQIGILKRIITYDVGEKRVNKIRKKLKMYLIWTQNSVFEGEITEAKLKKCLAELNKILNKEEDSLYIYRVKNSNNINILPNIFHIPSFLISLNIIIIRNIKKYFFFYKKNTSWYKYYQ